MKVEDQLQEPMKKVAGLIGDMRVCMMSALVDDRLESRPMTPLLLDSDGAVWFFTHGSSLEDTRLDTVNVGFSNEADAAYVSMEGHVEVIDDRARKQELWTAYAKPWFPDGPDSPDLVVLRFVPHAVDHWDSPSSKVVRLFAMAASIASARPVGLGEHAHRNLPAAR